MATLFKKPIEPSLTLALLPPSPLPSLLHSRSLSLPPTSIDSSHKESGESLGNEDWWRWSSPTIQEVKKSQTIGQRSLGLNTFSQASKKRTEGKLVGEWRVGEVLGQGSSGRLII